MIVLVVATDVAACAGLVRGLTEAGHEAVRSGVTFLFSGAACFDLAIVHPCAALDVARAAGCGATPACPTVMLPRDADLGCLRSLCEPQNGRTCFKSR